MNKKIFMTIVFLFSLASISFSIPAGGLYGDDIVDKIKLGAEDVPDGFVYGKIPTFAKEVLKNNPWSMDQGAINRLTKNIYPDGNYQAIKSIYVSILARKDSPYGDDIVCYIMVYRSGDAAKREIKKLEDFALYNKDRIIILVKNNVAVFLHVDDADDYSYISELSKKIQSKLNVL